MRKARLSGFALLASIAQNVAAAEVRPLVLDFAMTGMGHGRSIHLENGKLVCTVREPGGTRSLTLALPSPGKWRALRAELDRLAVWQWQDSYANVEVEDGTQWKLKVQYSDRAVTTQGYNAYPEIDGRASRTAEPTAAFLKLAAAIRRIAPNCRL